MIPVAKSTVLNWLVDSGFANEFVKSQKKDDFLLTGFSSIESAGPCDVCFWVGDTLKSETNANGIAESVLLQLNAGLVFVPESFCSVSIPNVRQVVPVKNPYHVMVEFLNRFAQDVEPESSKNFVAASAEIHFSAVVEGSVGENTVVGPNCVVMRGAEVGSNCVLEANVTVYPNVKIGNGCIFQAGAVIGSRGFGFYEYEGERRLVPHLAGVRIGDCCSFGANMVVAAGFVSPTKIGNDCHFDSFVQIAHNCNLGNNIYMASQSGIAGTVTVEDDAEFAGGAQSAGHLTIGKGARIAAKAGVTKSVPAGKTYAGFPAVDIAVWRRSVVNLRLMGKK